MRTLILAAAFVLAALPAFAAQNGTVTFDVPNTGGAPSGYRLYRDGTLVATVTSGQSVTALSPVDVGTIVLGVEAFNAAGAGPRVNKSYTLGAVLIQLPIALGLALMYFFSWLFGRSVYDFVGTLISPLFR